MTPTEPLLDAALTTDLFAVTASDLQADLRDMFGALTVDLFPRLQKLDALAAGGPDGALTAARELHQLRGVVANFGLRRAAALMQALEQGWNGLDESTRLAQLADITSVVRSGLAELVQTYPYLGGTG